MRVAHPVREWTPCHVTPGTCPLFYKQKGTTPQRQARLTGGTGLYMNYSIIFTEISYYPETSILLQIIHNYDISDYTRIRQIREGNARTVSKATISRII